MLNRISKVIVFSAPSGSGKSTIIRRLMADTDLRMSFSVSCTSRSPRAGEVDGREYFFITPEEFRERIAKGEFLEYEEVYEGRFYGTLRSQVDAQLSAGQNVVLDIDVKGASNVKAVYGERALTIFIQPPSIEELRHRLTVRGTEDEATIDTRISRAEYELSFAPSFDHIVINDDLDTAVNEAKEIIKSSLEQDFT